MSISYQQPLDLTCDKCHATHTVDLWLIIDAAERPDLWVSCQDGSIHTAACPNGHAIYLGAPLLLHDRTRKLVIFSPPLSPTSPAEEHQMVSSLMNRLRGSMPASDAHEKYLIRVKRVPRGDLSLELTETPGEAPGRQQQANEQEDEETADLFFQLSRPVATTELPRYIRLCEEALQRFKGEKHKDFRGWLNAKLGTFLANCASGDAAQNLERSIEARQAALTVYTRDAFPVEWARLLVNLGNVYARRIRGNRAENTALAAQAYRDALTVFTPDQYPEDWTRVQVNLKSLKAEDVEQPRPGRLKRWLTRLANPDEKADRVQGEGARLESGLPPTSTWSAGSNVKEGTPDTFYGPLKVRPDGSSPSLMTQINEAMTTKDMPRLIKLCKLMLQIVTPANNALQWAQLQHALGYGLINDPEGERAANIEQAISALEAAATIITPQSFPTEFVKLQNSLGIAYAQRVGGNDKDNQEKSVRAFEAAVLYADHAAEKGQLASLQQNLGTAYLSRPGRDDGENLSEAVRSITAMLDTCSYESSPAEWAQLQFNLRKAYISLARIKPDEQIARAIEEQDLRLTELASVADRSQWARAQFILGNLYARYGFGDPARNAARAINAYENALTVYTREDSPREWADAQLNLGNAYLKSADAGRADDVERAIEAYKAALTVHRLDTSPNTWADLQYNLGLAYEARVPGVPDQQAAAVIRDSNLELAIEAYKESLKVWTRDSFPFEWARTLVNLGMVYRMRLSGNPDENIEESRHVLESALNVLTRRDYPEEWAIAQYNLGETYKNRLVGDRAENQDRAVTAFEKALTVLTRERFLSEWAQVQKGLGDVYRQRVRGERAENSSKAVLAYGAALSVITREASPFEWAKLQIRLGISYANLDDAETISKRPRAVEAFEAALTVLTFENSSELWADAQHNLGAFLMMWKGGNRAENIERAIQAFEAVSAVRKQRDFRLEIETARDRHQVIEEARAWVSLQVNVGTAYEQRIHGERVQNLERARAAYEAALQVCGPGFGTDMARPIAAQLGSLQAELQHWPEAYAAFQLSLKASEREFSFALTEERKQSTIVENVWLYEKMVDACLRLNPAQRVEAFLIAEEGRSRIFRYQLSELPLPAPRGVPEGLISLEEQLLRQMRSLQSEINRTAPGEARWQLVEQANDIRDQLERLWNTLKHKHGVADYVALRMGEKLRWEEFKHWLSASA